MKILDWYIVKKFFTTFIFCMLLFTVIAVAVDSSEKTDDFVKSGLSTAQIIRQYYLGFVPWIWGLLYPLFVFIAVIFFTSKMALRSEIIAILASGTSYNRFLRPYIVSGFVFAFGLWLANRYSIPKANELRGTFQTQYIDKNYNSEAGSGTNFFDVYTRLDSSTYMGMKRYDTSAKAATNFFMEKVRNNRVYFNVRAQRINWDAGKKIWVLTSVVERTVDSSKESIQQFPEKQIALNLKPSELRRDEYLKDRLTTPELVEFINRQELRGTEGLNTLKVEQYRRTATPFTVLLLTIIGAVIAGRKTRGGSGLHLAIGILIAAIFLLSDKFSTVFSVKSNLPPMLAAWIPNIVFSLVAYYFYRTAPK
jgi:lipopolysaccharide export system permease protein